jgi:hypothetical protein
MIQVSRLFLALRERVFREAILGSYHWCESFEKVSFASRCGYQ